MIAKILLITLAPAIALTACAKSPAPGGPEVTRSAATSAQSAAAVDSPSDAPALAHMVVHKSPTCGCCELWVEHMREAGFHVEVRDSDDLNSIKEQLGVPYGKGSCHTAEVGGYFIEGHVPMEDIKRLLAQKPSAKGLVLPGMPAGSPGMEVPDGTVRPYTVELVDQSGSTVAFSHH